MRGLPLTGELQRHGDDGLRLLLRQLLHASIVRQGSGVDSLVNATQISERLAELQLPAGDYAVHSTASLVLRGILEEAGDLDIVCRRAAWERALEMVKHGAAKLMQGDVDQVVEVGDDVELFDGWLGVDGNVLIDEAELVAGVPCVTLAAVVEFKEQQGRPKDREHLARILLATEGLIEER